VARASWLAIIDRRRLARVSFVASGFLTAVASAEVVSRTLLHPVTTINAEHAERLHQS